MDKNKMIEEFVLSKTSIQMTKATLEESHIKKIAPITTSESLYNDLNFSYKVEEIRENKIESFMKTSIVSYKDKDTKVLELDVVFRGVFEIKEDARIDDTDFRNFVEAQTVPQLLPYARSFISSITVQMEIEPMTLPTMDIIQSLIDNRHHSDEAE